MIFSNYSLISFPNYVLLLLPNYIKNIWEDGHKNTNKKNTLIFPGWVLLEKSVASLGWAENMREVFLWFCGHIRGSSFPFPAAIRASLMVW